MAGHCEDQEVVRGGARARGAAGDEGIQTVLSLLPPSGAREGLLPGTSWTLLRFEGQA